MAKVAAPAPGFLKCFSEMLTCTQHNEKGFATSKVAVFRTFSKLKSNKINMDHLSLATKILNSRSSGNAAKGCSLLGVYDRIIQLLQRQHTPCDQCIVSCLGTTLFYEVLQLGLSSQKKHEIKWDLWKQSCVRMRTAIGKKHREKKKDLSLG